MNSIYTNRDKMNLGKSTIVDNAEVQLKKILRSYLKDGNGPILNVDLIQNVKTVHYPLMKGYPILLRDTLISLKESGYGDIYEAVSLQLIGLREILESLEIRNNLMDMLQVENLHNIWPAARSRHQELFSKLDGYLCERLWTSAENILDQLMEFWQVFHDGFVFHIHHVLNRILFAKGNTAVLTILKLAAEKSKSAYEHWASLNSNELIKAITTLLHAHGSQFSIVEENGHIQKIDIDFCSSGGMLLKKNILPTENIIKLTEEPHNATPYGYRFNRSTYCAHCVLWNEVLPQFWFGKQLFITHPDPLKVGRCQLYFNRENLPEGFSRNFLLLPEKDF